MHKGTVLVQYVQPDTVTTLILHYPFPQTHICPIYSKNELSRLAAAFIPATHSPVLSLFEQEASLLTGLLT